MVFAFFIAHLKGTPPQSSEVSLRFAPSEEGESLPWKELTNFCFNMGPKAERPKEFNALEEYVFVLTLGDGQRLYGFCRRFLPPAPKVGSKLRYPKVMCIVSNNPWCNFFFKILEVAEQLVRAENDLLLSSDSKEFPASSYISMFLKDLNMKLTGDSKLGSCITVGLPKLPIHLGVSPFKCISFGDDGFSLKLDDGMMEVQVPPDTGNGVINAGISLARLMWFVPVQGMLTLIASLLLERRIIIVGESREQVSNAVIAAAALIYPFKWVHIFLPIMPSSLMDYLTAPMPFIIGIQEQLLPHLKGIPMNEFTLINLSLRKVEPEPGSPNDDAHSLPFKSELEAALHLARKALKNPTEYQGNVIFSSVLREYFLKLFGCYRRFISEERVAPAPSPTTGTTKHQRRLSGDDNIRRDGLVFDHARFLNSFGLSPDTQRFLILFRQSQMFEVFVTERLALAKDGYAMDHEDTWENAVPKYQERWQQVIDKARSGMHRRGMSDETNNANSSSSQALLRMNSGAFDPTPFFELKNFEIPEELAIKKSGSHTSLETSEGKPLRSKTPSNLCRNSAPLERAVKSAPPQKVNTIGHQPPASMGGSSMSLGGGLGSVAVGRMVADPVGSPSWERAGETSPRHTRPKPSSSLPSQESPTSKMKAKVIPKVTSLFKLDDSSSSIGGSIIRPPPEPSNPLAHKHRSTSSSGMSSMLRSLGATLGSVTSSTSSSSSLSHSHSHGLHTNLSGDHSHHGTSTLDSAFASAQTANVNTASDSGSPHGVRSPNTSLKQKTVLFAGEMFNSLASGFGAVSSAAYKGYKNVELAAISDDLPGFGSYVMQPTGGSTGALTPIKPSDPEARTRSEDGRGTPTPSALQSPWADFQGAPTPLTSSPSFLSQPSLQHTPSKSAPDLQHFSTSITPSPLSQQSRMANTRISHEWNPWSPDEDDTATSSLHTHTLTRTIIRNGASFLPTTLHTLTSRTRTHTRSSTTSIAAHTRPRFLPHLLPRLPSPLHASQGLVTQVPCSIR